MDKDQITALAREYAEETVSHTRLSTTIADDAEDVIRFLLRRYCLVEKEVVRKEYQETCDHEFYATEHKNELYAKLYGMKRLTLESIFPEIAKEVER